MTRLLASVTGPEEALGAVAGGADLVDFKDPTEGALGALPLDVVAAGVGAVAGRRPVSATIGDPPLAPDRLREAVYAAAGAGVDYVKVGLAGPVRHLKPAIDALAGPAGEGVPLVAVLFGDREPDWTLIPRLAEAGLTGVMLDTAGKGAGPLPEHLGLPALARFLDRARAAGLLCGLAGSLRETDIPFLLPLGPDLLGFRGALCAQGLRTASLDPRALADLRQRIPPGEAAAGATR